MDPPPRHVLPKSAAGTGDQKAAIIKATSLVTAAKGWMCNTFLGHYAKQEKTMYQRLQNEAPPRIGTAIL